MNYVATDKDIEDLTSRHVDCSKAVESTGDTYLKLLIGTTQAELNEEHTQIQTMESVAARFYAAVLRALPVDAEPKERNRLSNWARTTKSTLRRWILVPGNDIRSLHPERVTKKSITVPRGEPKPIRSSVFENRVTKMGEDLDDLAKRLDPKAKKNAIAAIEDLITHAMAVLSEMGVEETKSPNIAIETGRPYRTKAGLFYPVLGGLNG